LNLEGRTAMLAPGESTRGSCVSILVLTLRFAVATVLAVAALAKARSFSGFRRTVAAIVPWRRSIAPVSATVIATEGTLAVLLATGVAPSGVAAATVVLFLGFSALSYWAMRSGVHISCNCFGSSDRELGRDSLETSLLLSAAALVYLALLQRTQPSLTLGEAPLAALLGVTAVLGARWLLALRDLIPMVRQRRLLERELAA
jgi:methylamine utilization protein MauE